MRYAPAILLGRLVRTLARLRKPGGGSAIPGVIVNVLAPGYLAHALNSVSSGLTIVSGSSGKSTTTKMLVAIVRAHGVSVFTNQSTANIAQGLTSALLEHADVQGRIREECAILEMDEGHGALIAPKLEPRVVVLTNVMTDQIDRFYDPEQVARMLGKIAERASETLVINADDALVAGLAASGKVSGLSRYGVSQEVLDAAPRGLGYARTATSRSRDPDATIVESVQDRSARIRMRGPGEHTGTRPSVPTEGTGRVSRASGDGAATSSIAEVALPARGIHFAVDAAAALAGAQAILGERFSLSKSVEALRTVPPVFGRGEILDVRGQRVEFVLVQNPASFQLNVDTLPPECDCVFIAIGSDVRDFSYLWPVDLRRLRGVKLVSGSLAWEMALQLAYQEVPVDRVEPDLHLALDAFLDAPAPASGTKTIIFSADAMRRIRRYLGLDAQSGWKAEASAASGSADAA